AYLQREPPAIKFAPRACSPRTRTAKSASCAEKDWRSPVQQNSGKSKFKKGGSMIARANVARCWLALICSALVAAAPAPLSPVDAAPLTPQEERLIAAAKSEGAVIVLNAQFSDETAQLLGEDFVKRYDLGPDFKFNNLRKGTGAAVAQVRQEMPAGKHTVDIINDT